MDEILTKVKNALGITSDALNETLKVYIDDAIGEMRRAGVSEKNIMSSDGKVVIAFIVRDSWNYGSGEVRLSSYTKERIIQLKYAKTEENSEESGG